jgi:hypothetical protein
LIGFQLSAFSIPGLYWRVKAIIQMKYTDDYSAKLRLWAEKPTVVRLPELSGLPKFSAKKFRSHAEMNAWKIALLRQIAAQNGCRWTK